MKLVVSGSRGMTDPGYVYAELTRIKHLYPIEEIIEGNKVGVERIARQWAFENDVNVRTYTPDWERYGEEAARPLHHLEMAQKGDLLLAIWDAQDGDTRNLIEHFRQLGKFSRISIYTSVGQTEENSAEQSVVGL